MWIVRLALRRPYTFVVMSLLIAVLGLGSIVSMPRRFKLSSHARLMFAGELSTPMICLVAASNLKPNLVATMTVSRGISARNFPSSFSFS